MLKIVYKIVEFDNNFNYQQFKESKIKEYKELDITYHPKMVKTKKINKQEELKMLRYKFEHNKILTSTECIVNYITSFRITRK